MAKVPYTNVVGGTLFAWSEAGWSGWLSSILTTATLAVTGGLRPWNALGDWFTAGELVSMTRCARQCCRRCSTAPCCLSPSATSWLVTVPFAGWVRRCASGRTVRRARGRWWCWWPRRVEGLLAVDWLAPSSGLRTHPVDEPPKPLRAARHSLVAVHGNVAEWVWDLHDSAPHPELVIGGDGDDDLVGGDGDDVLCDTSGSTAATCATNAVQTMDGGFGADVLWYDETAACAGVTLDAAGSSGAAGADECGDRNDWAPAELPGSCLFINVAPPECP